VLTPAEFPELLGHARALAIVRASSPAIAGAAMEAAVRGGLRVIEFTMNTPGALDLIREFAARPGLVVGAGTVLETAQAEAAVAAGARFLVSPVVDPEVIAAAARLAVAVMPGAQTPTEMWRAHQAGAQVIKLFPAPAQGPETVRSILAPMPFLRIVPTNGVNAENAASYLAAGALAVGLTRALFDPGEVAAARWDLVEERARGLLAGLAGC